MRPGRSLTNRLVIPVVLAGLIAAGAGLVAAAVLADRRLGFEAEQRAQDQLVALETVANVSDLAGLQRATTAVGAARDIGLVLVAGGEPRVILAASDTSLIGRPFTAIGDELRDTVAAPTAESLFQATRQGDTLTMVGRWRVRETTRDGTDLTDAVGLVTLDLSKLSKRIEGDTLVAAVGEVLAVLMVAGLAIVLIRRHVLGPLRAVARNVGDKDEGGGGDHSCLASCTSTEIHDLATSLHEALAARAESEVELAEINRQLESSNSRLERLVESKDEFLASVSHELRTPLTTIVGFAEHLKEADLELSSADRVDMVETICAEGADVIDLIEDLLTAARADIDRIQMSKVRVDLLAQSHQVAEGLAGRLGTLTIEGNHTHVSGDPRRVRQVVRNLLTNAERYGGPNVTIEIVADAGHGLLRVIDDGQGIPAEAAERVFEPYERAHDGTQVFDSVGIGLPVSRTLARLMSGDLTYRRDGDTSVFELSLPLLTPAPDAASDASLAAALS